jgi:hypothetical protein
MLRFAGLLGKRVEVIYRAGEIHLRATATLVGDSGKSIFLEERFLHHDTVKTFRWEIPYPYIVRIHECVVIPAEPAADARSGVAARAAAAAKALGLSEIPEKA